MYEQGFLYEFHLHSGTIYEFEDNIFYFETFPNNEIYKIDLNGPYNKENSIYNQPNNKKKKLYFDNKTYLWHCHLGHINKAHIAMLQKNRILESTDLESFDVCESCMYRKTTNAPFTNVHERP